MAVRGRASFRSRGQKRGEQVLRGLNDEIHWKRLRFSKENREISKEKYKRAKRWNVDEMEIGSSLEISGEYFANRKSKGNISKFEKNIYIHIYVPDEKWIPKR